FSISHLLPFLTQQVQRLISGLDLALRTGGMEAVLPWASAEQPVLSGQIRQAGDLGVQMSAPSSMRAELKSPGLDGGSSSSARRQSLLLTSLSAGESSIPSSRQSTLVTLPSRIGALIPNAMEAIAPAV